MASAANAPSEQESGDPDRPRITRRSRGDFTRSTPLDLEYLQRPSYCDAGFALEQITEVLISYFTQENALRFYSCRIRSLKKSVIHVAAR